MTDLKAEIETVRVVVHLDDDPDISWLDQEEWQDEAGKARKASFGDDWWLTGVIAEARLKFSTPQGGWIYGPTVSSGGIWGVESDCGNDYLITLGDEQLTELRDQLAALGFTTQEITTAYEYVER